MLTLISESRRKEILRDLQEEYVKRFARLENRALILKYFLEVIPESHLNGYGIEKKGEKFYIENYGVEFFGETSATFYCKNFPLDSGDIDNIVRFLNKLDISLSNLVKHKFLIE